jgi:hypothetical protein
MTSTAEKAFQDGEGILRMAPNWVPRSFCIPGARLKLHLADLYAYGAHRGGIDERWFASTVKADNGPLTLPDEGLSYVVCGKKDTDERILFKDVVAELGAALIGRDLWERYGTFPVFAKFFDNRQALPFHLHHRKEHAALVGQPPKPEAYYFPPQMNNHMGEFPYTFFGLEPGTTPEDVKFCLRRWHQGDNGILDLSRAYRLSLGTGWNIPAGILHAPGSLCTYEPQWASDIYAMFQSLVNDVPFGWEMLTHYVPEERRQDLDFIVSLIDWEANTDPQFRRNHLLLPEPVRPVEEMQEEGALQYRVVYNTPLFSSKEVQVLPGRSILLKDDGAYSVIAVQGHGVLGVWNVETPTLIRFGQLTQDEFFVSASAAKEGVRVENQSPSEPLILLQTFGPKL